MTVQPLPRQALIGELCRLLRIPHSATEGLPVSCFVARGHAGSQGTVTQSQIRDER